MSSSCTHAGIPDKAAEPDSSTPYLEIVFDVDSKDKPFKLYQRPLGAEFSKNVSGSAMVRKVQARSYASELGLEAGWIVKSVGGEDVSGKNFQQVQNCIKGGMSCLPQQL
jgi:hypothetical protein